MASGSILSLQTVGIIIICMIIVTIINVTLTILLYIKLNKYRNGYTKLALKFNKETIEEDIKSIIEYINSSEELTRTVQSNLEQVQGSIQCCIQKVGLIKYDAYDSGNNLLSFALALLDKDDNGILLNSVHNRNYSNIYVKNVKFGEVSGIISQEENEALRKAVNKKEFMK